MSTISDWRIELFGDNLIFNCTGNECHAFDGKTMELEDSEDMDEERGQVIVPTTEALDPADYDYVAIFIGADYCPHCKKFAPSVAASAPMLEDKRCKTIFVSNDRTEEAFQASCVKNKKLSLIMPYNLEKTRAMRELFGLKTIPALMIIKNSDFDSKTPTVVTNARNILEDDPQGLHFPWKRNSQPELPKEKLSLMDRLIISGKYGKWWELGHHANPEKPGEVYMDEHAVRIRAGLLNVVSWLAIINIFYWKEPSFVKILFPVVASEFIFSANLGLTPLAPVGTIATVIAHVLQPEPHWKPARPKRFAWYIGLALASSCLLIFLLRDHMDEDLYRPLIGSVAMMCNLATWLEASAGWCLGCFIYNTYMVPMFKLEECSECKL